MTPDKLDSAEFADIYTELIKALPLLPEHREQLHQKRGFSDQIIDQLKFRSCSVSETDTIVNLAQSFSPRELRQSGVFINDGPNPKLTTDNILIPFFENDKVVYLKPHKNAFSGFALKPYVPAKLKSFTILAESEFKAAAALQLGYSSIGLTGVSSFSGKHFPKLVELLQSQNVTTICVIFDTEAKDDPSLPGFKKYFWERFDTQFYAYLMAMKLEADGFEATVACLPESWMTNGKADIDGALSKGKTKEAFDPVVKSRQSPSEYLKSLPKDAQSLIKRLYAKWNTHFAVRLEHSRYLVPRGKGEDATEIPVTNFELKIDNNIYGADGECRREVTLENDVGDMIHRAVFEGEHLSHYLSFRRRCLGLGNFQFTGTQKDMEAIVGFETAREVGKKVYQPDHVGWIKAGDIFLFENCAVGRNGERVAVDDDGVVWLGLTGFQAVSLQQGSENERTTIPRLWHEDVDPNALIGQIEQNFGGFMGIRLACSWVISTLFSHQLSTLYGSAFPMLFISGQQQSGKTTLAHWLSAMVGVQTEGNNYFSGTLVGFQRSISYYSSLPFWLDEYRNSTEPSIRAKEGFFRSAYDGQTSPKGLRNPFGVRGTTVRGRLMVTGQDTPADVALQQRCVTVRLNQKSRSGGEYVDLNSRIEQFSGIIPPLIKRYAAKHREVVRAIHTMREYLHSKGLDDRTAITYALVVGVYDGLIKENDKEFLDFCVRHAREAFAEKEAERPSRQFLEGIQELKQRGLLNGNMIRATSEGLAIYTAGVIGLWREKLWSRREDFPFKSSTLLNEFEESGFLVEKNKNVRIGKQTLKCMVLDATKDHLVRAIYDTAEAEEGP